MNRKELIVAALVFGALIALGIFLSTLHPHPLSPPLPPVMFPVPSDPPLPVPEPVPEPPVVEPSPPPPAPPPVPPRPAPPKPKHRGHHVVSDYCSQDACADWLNAIELHDLELQQP